MPGGLQRNWVLPKNAARPDDMAYIAESALSTEFRRATVVAHHPTYILVTWDAAKATETSVKLKTEVISRENTSVWHGTVADEAWEPAGPETPDIHVPKSRQYCPETYKQIAARHGVEPPSFKSTADVPPVRSGGRPRSVMVPPVATNTTKDQAAATPASATPPDACTPPSTAANSSGPTPADNAPTGAAAPATGSATQGQNGFTNHDRDAEKWLLAVRRYGDHISDPVLQQMPRFLGLRRDLFVHSYALWLVVMVRPPAVLLALPSLICAPKSNRDCPSP